MTKNKGFCCMPAATVIIRVCQDLGTSRVAPSPFSPKKLNLTFTFCCVEGGELTGFALLPRTEVAENNCVYRNEIHHAAGERTQVLQDVASDPTLPRTKTARCAVCNHGEAVFFQQYENIKFARRHHPQPQVLSNARRRLSSADSQLPYNMLCRKTILSNSRLSWIQSRGIFEPPLPHSNNVMAFKIKQHKNKCKRNANPNPPFLKLPGLSHPSCEGTEGFPSRTMSTPSTTINMQHVSTIVWPVLLGRCPGNMQLALTLICFHIQGPYEVESTFFDCPDANGFRDYFNNWKRAGRMWLPLPCYSCHLFCFMIPLMLCTKSTCQGMINAKLQLTRNQGGFKLIPGATSLHLSMLVYEH
eukprot:Gb_02047 [translate_table: standard]